MKFYSDTEVCDNLEHYSLKRVWSFRVSYRWLIGGRGYGKTFSIKKYLFGRFKKRKAKFAWVRTTEKALEKVATTEQFFGRMKSVLKEMGFKQWLVKNNMIYLDGELAGYFFAVSTFYNNKGSDYEIETIVWDEFMKADGERPVPNKYSKYMDLVQSVCRGDNVQSIGLSNSTNQYDEVLQHYKVKLNGFGVYLYREQNALVHYIRPSKKFLESQKGSLSDVGMSEQDKKMVFKNEFTDYGDYGDLSKAKYLFSIQTDHDKYLSVYITKQMIYIKSNLPDNPYLCCFDPQFVNVKVRRISVSQKRMVTDAYNNGRIIFADGYSRAALQSYIV